MNVKNFISYAMVITIASCTTGNNNEVVSETPELPVIQLATLDTSIQNGYVADIQAVQNVEIRSKVQGYLEKIFVDEGKEVKKGQPLFKLNDQQFQLQVNKAKAGVANAQAEVNAAELEIKRIQLLVDKKIISKTELELAQSKLKGAQARLSEAKAYEADASLRLSYTMIRAPFTGVLDRIPLKLGSLVDEGTLLTTVSDLSEVVAYFNVSENEYLDYKRKLQNKDLTPYNNVKLVLADGTIYSSPGKVETLEGEFDQGTGSIAFRARFPNPDMLLKHGSSGKVSLTTRVQNALLVPQKAVFDIQDKNYVFIMGADSTVKMKTFTPGTRVNEYFLVKSGLSAGDKIVYEGVQNIKDGMRIQPRMVQTDSLLAMK
ncbi:efflux RND transporter periplasmic adaptor subunit [Panacibacter sp. DH6]|uniref:Efflux RND transporter periplasmic adaptor subunit n=1 Tax=Panacibacter microcysteis TaxID=2793269 RepID=A0A931GWJ4_9BACT|nr:efflux RND transporter periplasmic adaptor subunit [Panacibacter microcysteis]MBG9376423.1 efflux RND transporter periplasmic adaptor subunit [Panacibacter microcysteis]